MFTSNEISMNPKFRRDDSLVVNPSVRYTSTIGTKVLNLYLKGKLSLQRSSPPVLDYCFYQTTATTELLIHSTNLIHNE